MADDEKIITEDDVQYGELITDGFQMPKGQSA